jgi:threonine dehydrogenase-like Zn-dependent dehydrogenase
VRRFNPRDFPRAVDMIASGRIEVASLITHHFPLDEITPAFEMLHSYSDGVVKTIIHPHEADAHTI